MYEANWNEWTVIWSEIIYLQRLKFWLLSMTQSSGLTHGSFFFEEGKGGMSLKQSGCEGDRSSGNKTIKLSRDKKVRHLSRWPIDVKDFLNVKFALCKLFNRLSLWRRADTRNVSLLTIMVANLHFQLSFLTLNYLLTRQKVDWYTRTELGRIITFFTSLSQLNLDRFAPGTKPLNLPLTLWYKFRYRFPDTLKNCISQCPT